jgi:hypothetical protein
MITHNLWPTKVVIESVDIEKCLNVLNSYFLNSDKDWENVLDKTFQQVILDIANVAFDGKFEICEGWIRTISTSTHNDFDIHSDSHYGGHLVAVLQVSGDENCGGELVVYDPSWNNPQWVSDTNNINSNTFTIPFKMGSLIIFPSNVWHKVKAYNGKNNRNTLNLILKKIA